MSEPTTSAGGPMTVVVSRSVKPGSEQDFETWLKGTIEALAQYPGYQGANIVRPDAHTNHEYVVMPLAMRVFSPWLFPVAPKPGEGKP